MNDAEQFLFDIYGHDQFDGENFDWQDTLVFGPILASVDITNRHGHGTLPTRIEFEDGSAIVECEAAWDFGVHRDRLPPRDDAHFDAWAYAWVSCDIDECGYRAVMDESFAKNPT